jgi:hypothetical protein
VIRKPTLSRFCKMSILAFGSSQTTLARRAKLMAAVGHPPQIPPPAPPSCSECSSKTQPAAGGPPTQSASRMWRSGDGKTRIDTATTSVISDPVAQHTIVLDHAKKEAMVIPMLPAGSAPAAPHAAAPGAPAAPQAPPVHVEDLGKSTIEGHEVEGKRYSMPPFTPPPKPAMPAAKMPAAKMPGMKMPAVPPLPGGKVPDAKLPGAPAAPKPPAAPTAPQPPKLPSKPSVTEVWTSVKLKTPVLTKTSTLGGEQTTYCKPTETAEHHPSIFQIPPGYKIKPPKL